MWAKRPKNEGENHHAHERLQNGPGRADGRLLVADLDLAPDEEIDQLAVFPELGEGDGPPASGGSDAQDWRRRVGWRFDARRGRGSFRSFGSLRLLELLDVALLDAIH